MDFAASALTLGVGATLIMNLWGIARSAVFKQPKADYALLLGICGMSWMREPRVLSAVAFGLGLYITALLLRLFSL